MSDLSHQKPMRFAPDATTIALGAEHFIAVSAVRYALGRQTYIVEETVTWLISMWPVLCDRARKIIEAYVERAFVQYIDLGTLSLGADIDVAQWKKARELWS